MAAASRRARPGALSEPVDLALASDADSAATLGLAPPEPGAVAGRDLFVANRGDGTLARLSAGGAVLARARVLVDGAPLGPGRLNGIAASRDGGRLWLTTDGGEGALASGALLEVATFGPEAVALAGEDRVDGRASAAAVAR